MTGQLFLPNESITLYWDDPSRVAGSTICNGSGAFTVVVKPFPGDAPGVHHLYAGVEPKPHADFTLEGAPTPTPAASPSPSDLPSPSPSPIESPSPSPSPSAIPVANISGIDIITRPPFVFLPIIGALGLLGVIAYWALGSTRRNPTSVLPASVVHRSFRPDYGAPLGTPAPPAATTAPPPPPATVIEPPPEPPAPAEPPAVAPPPPPEPQAAEPPPAWPYPPAEPPAHPAPPAMPGPPDAPPDLPEPSD